MSNNLCIYCKKLLKESEENLVCDKCKQNTNITCPFCKEIHDFDLEGLKDHLLSGSCNTFNQTKVIY